LKSHLEAEKAKGHQKHFEAGEDTVKAHSLKYRSGTTKTKAEAGGWSEG